MPFTKSWTDAEKENLKQHYPFLPSQKLAEAFPGRTPRALSDMAQTLGVRKTQERLNEMGRDNCTLRWQRIRAGRRLAAS